MTLGQLIASLYTEAERRFHDDKLAAVATQVVVQELLGATAPQRTRANKRGA